MRDLSTVQFSRGDVIFRDGEPSDAVYITLGPTDATYDALQEEIEMGAMLTSETRIDGGEEHELHGFVPAGRMFGEEGLVYRWVLLVPSKNGVFRVHEVLPVVDT